MSEVFHAGETWIHLDAIEEGTLHVRVCLGADQPARPSYAVLPQLSGAFALTRKETPDAVLLLSAAFSVRVSKADLALTVTDARGAVVHQDVPGRAYRRDPLGRSLHYFQIDGFHHAYGLGERAGALDRMGRRFSLDMRDAIGYDAERTDPLYKHIPFIIRRDIEHGLFCGLFYDAPCRGEVDLGQERSGYWPPYCKVALESPQIDYFILLGSSMRDVLRRYTRLTGTTAMPPLPSLGHMASTMYLTELDKDCDRAIEDFIDQLHSRGFGCDGYHLSSGYTSIHGKRYVYHWNTERFPDPERFIHSLTERGLLVSPNIKPAMLTDHPLYEAFAQAGAFLMDKRTGKPYLTRYWGGTASYIDMLSPAGRAMWIAQMKAQLLNKGVNAVWDDNNEYELDDDNAVTAGDDRPAYALRPAFANCMAQAARQAMSEACPTLRPYVLSRSGYAGIQRYAQTWAGDNRTSWHSLKYNIPIMLGMSLSGVANQGCDIGGFAGPAPDAELFVRWVQNGIFQPRFCLHSCNDDNTITLPWGYEGYTDYVLAAFRLRYALAPYWYGLMRQAFLYGDPIMRPMCYAFDEPALADESFDFMIGDALLVANVVEPGAVTRRVRLPQGYDWFDWDTHERYEGGQEIVVDAPLDKIPLFYRSGSIIPMAQPALQLTPQVFRRLTLLAEASCACSFVVYQDDGISQSYQSGEYLETAVTLTPEEDRILLDFAHSGTFPDGVDVYEIRLSARSISPLSIRLESCALAQALSVEEYEAAACDVWYFSLARRHVMIRLANPRKDFRLTVDYRIHDLIGM